MQAELIPIANPKASNSALRERLDCVIHAVVDGGRYVLGPRVAAFEREFAEFLGVRECVAVASGTDALALSLRAVGVETGDEVITVANTAIATVAAIEQIGARPVLADVDPVTRCIDPGSVDSLISPATRALVPVHLYGRPAPMEALGTIARGRGLAIVEDCAQAHGAAIGERRVGSFGDAAAFSFYPTKNLGALGDGGAIATGRSEVAERVRALRQYGWDSERTSHLPGVNSRLDELQAAVLSLKLPELEKGNARRREIARRYSAAITSQLIRAPALRPDLHAMHLYVVECEERDRLRDDLFERGIQTSIHYATPIHRHPAYAGRLRGSDELRWTEHLADRVLSLPMYPELREPEIERICAALGSWS
jgi:dTDP-4-amino-4,6-dideoxygalactose transaminase